MREVVPYQNAMSPNTRIQSNRFAPEIGRIFMVRCDARGG